MGINLAVSNTCSAFAEKTIGTKVTHAELLRGFVERALGAHDASQDRVSGQHYLRLAEDATVLVSAGVGGRVRFPENYVLRAHRGRVNAYLRREYALNVDSVAVVVYTREAYLADPDVQRDAEERARIEASNATHIIVAVLASAGPPSPYTPFRLVENLAGGNREAATWTADEIRAKAVEAAAYADAYDVVAD